MYIISDKSQKDYFDRHVKDGIDMTVVLKRTPTFDSTILADINSSKKSFSYKLLRLRHSDTKVHYEKMRAFSLISVCGIPYILHNTASIVSEMTKPKRFYFISDNTTPCKIYEKKSLVITGDEFLQLIDTERYVDDYNHWFDLDKKNYDNLRWMANISNKMEDSFVEIHKKLNSPVFRINSDAGVSQDYPNLSDYNFARLIPSNIMYQDVMQFMISMKSCNPPVDLGSDKDKIIKAGFDLKTSFRHRK